jgi:hypothetical protein
MRLVRWATACQPVGGAGLASTPAAQLCSTPPGRATERGRRPIWAPPMSRLGSPGAVRRVAPAGASSPAPTTRRPGGSSGPGCCSDPAPAPAASPAPRCAGRRRLVRRDSFIVTDLEVTAPAAVRVQQGPAAAAAGSRTSLTVPRRDLRPRNHSPWTLPKIDQVNDDHSEAYSRIGVDGG